MIFERKWLAESNIAKATLNKNNYCLKNMTLAYYRWNPNSDNGWMNHSLCDLALLTFREIALCTLFYENRWFLINFNIITFSILLLGVWPGFFTLRFARLCWLKRTFIVAQSSIFILSFVVRLFEHLNLISTNLIKLILNCWRK